MLKKLSASLDSFLLVYWVLQPITWATLGVMMVAGGGVVMYVNERHKEKDELRKKNSTKSVGKADLGGPFDLIDHNNQRRTDKDYIGKWLMIYFGFTFCPDICPDELDKLTRVLNRLGKPLCILQLLYKMLIDNREFNHVHVTLAVCTCNLQSHIQPRAGQRITEKYLAVNRVTERV